MAVSERGQVVMHWVDDGQDLVCRNGAECRSKRVVCDSEEGQWPCEAIFMYGYLLRSYQIVSPRSHNWPLKSIAKDRRDEVVIKGRTLASL